MNNEKLKICIACGSEKTIGKFIKDRNLCKKCKKEYDGVWRKKNKSNMESYNKKKKDGWENSERKKKDNELKRDRRAQKIGFKNHAEKIEYDEFIKREKEDLKKIKKIKKLEENKVKKEVWKKNDLLRRKERRKTDLEFKLKDNLRARTRKALRCQSAKKTTPMAKLLGLSGKELKKYLENNGYKDGYQIDHIIPLSRFNLQNIDHQKIALFYMNLQPLSEFDNMSKGDKLPVNWENRIILISKIRSINPKQIIKYIERDLNDNIAI